MKKLLFIAGLLLIGIAIFLGIQLIINLGTAARVQQIAKSCITIDEAVAKLEKEGYSCGEIVDPFLDETLLQTYVYLRGDRSKVDIDYIIEIPLKPWNNFFKHSVIIEAEYSSRKITSILLK